MKVVLSMKSFQQMVSKIYQIKFTKSGNLVAIMSTEMMQI